MQTAQNLWCATVKAHGLNLRTGILDEERLCPQLVDATVDVFFPADTIVAPTDIGEVVDYDRIKRALDALESAPHVDLLESIAIGIANACFIDSRIWRARVILTKTQIYGDRIQPSVTLDIDRAEWYWRFSSGRPSSSIMVAAIDQSGILGDGASNTIPWNIPSDVRGWKARCRHKNIIIGRRTLESTLSQGCERFWEHLYVVTQERHGYWNKFSNVTSVPSLGHALSLCTNQHVVISGGAHLFAEAMRRDAIDEIYLSCIEADYASMVGKAVRLPPIPCVFLPVEQGEASPKQHEPGDESPYRIELYRRVPEI